MHDERPRPTTGHGSCDRSWPSGGIPPDISGVLRTRWRRVRSGIGRRLRRSPACPRLGGIVRLGPTRRILLLAVDRRRRQPIRIRSVPPSGNHHLNPEYLNLGVSERVVSQDVARIAQRSRQARATRQRGAGDRTTRTDSNDDHQIVLSR